MPQIIVTAGDNANLEGTVTLRERINASDFESERFAVNLLERLGWAVSDATEAEQRSADLPHHKTDDVQHGDRAERKPRDLVGV
jgi:hypothetical protein